MLALSRKKNEALVLNNNIEITILEIKGEQVKLGISAPKDVPVYRKEVERLVEKLRNQHQIFEKQVTDAAHIAVASIAKMDVLLTWNCKHMANIVELPKTVRIVTQAGYECPMIITPKDYLEQINV